MSSGRGFKVKTDPIVRRECSDGGASASSFARSIYINPILGRTRFGCGAMMPMTCTCRSYLPLQRVFAEFISDWGFGPGEQGVDEGGLAREFFRLLSVMPSRLPQQVLTLSSSKHGPLLVQKS